MAGKKRKIESSAGLPTMHLKVAGQDQQPSDDERRTEGAAERRQLPRAALVGGGGLVATVALALVLARGTLFGEISATPSPAAPATSTAAPAVGAAAPTATATPAGLTAVTTLPTATNAPATAIATPTTVPSPTATTAPPATIPATTAAAAAQPAGPQAGTSVECPAISGLPTYTEVTCVRHQRDQDDGIIKFENTYLSSSTAEDVRRFYESAFAQHGWTVRKVEFDAEEQDWSYSIVQGLRELKVEIETEQSPSGTFTRIHVAED